MERLKAHPHSDQVPTDSYGSLSTSVFESEGVVDDNAAYLPLIALNTVTGIPVGTNNKQQDLHPRLSRASHAGGSWETASLRVEADADNDAPSLTSASPPSQQVQGHATIMNEIANVAKNLIGGGVLSLSGGIAFYADDPHAALSAVVWIILMGILLGYFALLIAKVCCVTKAATYRECWQRTMGEHGALAVSIANAVNPAMGNLAYAAILSQSFQSLLETIGIAVTRIESLWFITIFALLPLCLLKNLYGLAPFSVLGTAGVIMTAGAMVLRCIDGSYQQGGKYYDDILPEFRPSFGSRNQATSSQVLPLVCMLFQAFVMHYNCPRFYSELENASVPRFANVVAGSFGLSSVLYIVIAVAGFLTFGGNANGYILNNYSPFDPLATACRLAITFSTLLTYPLAFIGLRDGVLDIFHILAGHMQRNQHFLATTVDLNALTVVLLTLITVTACFVTDLGVINAVAGGFLATAIVFVFPALMFRQQAVKDAAAAGNACGVDNNNNSISKPHPSRKMESTIALGLMVVGVALGLIGAWVALQA